MSRFTQGPWSVIHPYDGSFLIFNEKKPFEIICSLFAKLDGEPEFEDAIDKKTQEANARLIQHAPEMYALLYDIAKNGINADYMVYARFSALRLLARIDGKQEAES